MADVVQEGIHCRKKGIYRSWLVLLQESFPPFLQKAIANPLVLRQVLVEPQQLSPVELNCPLGSVQAFIEGQKLFNLLQRYKGPLACPMLHRPLLAHDALLRPWHRVPPPSLVVGTLI